MRGELVDPVNNAAFIELMLTITLTARFKLRGRQLLATFAIRKTFFVAIATHHGRKRKLRATSRGSFVPTTYFVPMKLSGRGELFKTSPQPVNK